MKTIKIFIFGTGVSFGGGMIYTLFISEIARLIGFGLLMLFLGLCLFGIPIYLVNRQWLTALGMQHNNVRNSYQILPAFQQQFNPELQPQYYDALPAQLMKPVNQDDAPIA